MQPASSTALTPWRTQYVARKDLFNFLGASFRLFDDQDQLVFFVKQKAFKLKEEITVFADEAQSQPRLHIRARNIMDISATYDVSETDGTVVGAIRRQGMKSIFRDTWLVLDTSGAEIAKIEEDSLLAALFRRFVTALLPQTFGVTDASGKRVAEIKQRFTFFRLTYDVRLDGLDPRLGVAAAVLLLAIEGRQQG
jgi:uncharacterized protein YxjI